MVNYRSNVLEEPLVGAIPYPVYVLTLRACEVRPALGDDGAGISNTDSFEYNADHLFWVV